jgi:hypothetical protein
MMWCENKVFQRNRVEGSLDETNFTSFAIKEAFSLHPTSLHPPTPTFKSEGKRI